MLCGDTTHGILYFGVRTNPDARHGLASVPGIHSLIKQDDAYFTVTTVEAASVSLVSS